MSESLPDSVRLILYRSQFHVMRTIAVTALFENIGTNEPLAKAFAEFLMNVDVGAIDNNTVEFVYVRETSVNDQDDPKPVGAPPGAGS